MTDNTEYLGLLLDDEDEFYDIEKTNQNLRKIDAGFGTLDGKIQAVKNPVFEDYTESEIPEPETALEEIVSGKPIDVIHQYTKASLMGILTVAKKALNIALGRNQARVFASVADLDAWLSVPENVSKLNVGDNFYIVATDVPDYWWDGNTKQKLETQKVDLTTYDQRITANTSAISELNGNFSVKSAMRVSWTTGRGSALGLPDETGYYVLNRMAV